MEKQSKSYIKYNEFNRNFIKLGERKEVTTTINNQQIKYYSIPVQYNMGSEEQLCYNDFILEGPEITSRYGIQTKSFKSDNGDTEKVQNSVSGTLDNNCSNSSEFVDVCDQINDRIAELLSEIAGQIGKRTYTKEIFNATVKKLVYIKIDEVTGARIGNPYFTTKLFCRGKPPMYEKTLFTDASGTQIPWEILEDVTMSYIPLYKISRIYIGSTLIVVQGELVSAIVTDIQQRGSIVKQQYTIDQLKIERPGLADQVAAQVAKISAVKEAQKTAEKERERSLEIPSHGLEFQQMPPATPITCGIPTIGASPQTPSMVSGAYTPYSTSGF